MAILSASPNSFSQLAVLSSEWPGSFWLHWVVFTVIILAFVLNTALIFIWLERRVLGRFQVRLGPNRVGPFGLLQPIADVLKLLTKEDIIPAKGDKLVFLAGTAGCLCSGADDFCRDSISEWGAAG